MLVQINNTFIEKVINKYKQDLIWRKKAKRLQTI